MIAEGTARVHPVLKSTLREHKHVYTETTGASLEILDRLAFSGPKRGHLLVRIQASLETCLRRIAIRAPTQQFL